MRTAVISDVHANLEALEAVIADIEKQIVDKVYCLGDIVGYGPNPKECVGIARERFDLTVLGNHDANTTGIKPISNNHNRATETIKWGKKLLDVEDITFLTGLPYTCSYSRFIFVHGDLTSPKDFNYIWRTVPENFQMLGSGNVLLVGHEHIPELYTKKGPVIVTSEETQSFDLSDKRK